MKIGIGCDEVVYVFKEVIKVYLVGKGFDVVDFGIYDMEFVIYFDIVFVVVEQIW